MKDKNGNITEIYGTYDSETKSGSATSPKKIKGTIYWVSAEHSRKAKVHLFDRLYCYSEPDNVEEEKTFLDNINPCFFSEIDVFIEPKLIDESLLQNYQFEGLGYFCINKDSNAETLVFNRTVTLNDNWAKTNALH